MSRSTSLVQESEAAAGVLVTSTVGTIAEAPSLAQSWGRRATTAVSAMGVDAQGGSTTTSRAAEKSTDDTGVASSVTSSSGIPIMGKVELHPYVLACLYDNIGDCTDEEQLGGAEEKAEIAAADSIKIRRNELLKLKLHLQLWKREMLL